MSTLYELTGEYLQLLEMAQDPEVDEQALADTMEAIEGELEEKAEAYANIIEKLNSDAERLKNEIVRLSGKKSNMENAVKRMKDNLQRSMEATGKLKFKTLLYSFSVQNNPASVVLEEGVEIPAEFLIPQDPKVDKAKIKDALKDGEDLPFARLEQGRSLRIR